MTISSTLASTHTTATDKINISVVMVQDGFVEPILTQTRHSVASAAALFERNCTLHCDCTANRGRAKATRWSPGDVTGLESRGDAAALQTLTNQAEVCWVD